MPKSLYVNNTDLTRDKRYSFTTEDIFASGTTLRLQSLAGFESLGTSSGQVICIGELGNERTEIRRTSNTTALSYTYNEVTLRDALQFDHPQDTKIYIIDWDRVEFQWAASVNGTKATVAAYPFNIIPDKLEMLYVDTSATAGYFFSRFNNTINSINSDWSDAIPFGGFDDNTVFMIKKRALDQVGETIDGETITHELLNQWLWEARREYHQASGKRPFRRKFNFIMPSSALTGSYRIELPTDVENPQTAENIYGVRIGTNPNMRYYDKKEWDRDYIGIPHTTLTTAYTVGARDLYVTNARDFSGSGAVSIEGTSISYSDKSNTGGTLRISTQGSWNASAGSDVWQNARYGLPDKFTVWMDPQGSAYIYFNRAIDTAYTGQNIYLDYYRTLVGYDSDADVLDEPEYDMFVAYLSYKIKERKSKGNIPVIRSRTGQPIIADADFQTWQQKKAEALSKENVSTDINLKPNVFQMPY